MVRSITRADVTRSAILAHLGSQGPTTRAALARSLDVSPALITNLTRDLVGEGLVEEGESERVETGRPGKRLRLVSRGSCAIGVKIADDHLVCVEVGLDGTVVRSASEPFAATAPTFLSELTRRLKDFLDGVENGDILGIGIGVSGSVDTQANGIVDSLPLQWRSVALGATLREEFGLPVIVENDVNALAAAERLYGIGRRYDDFLVLTIGSGIGSALVIGGVVVRGAHGGAGEFGHIPAAYEDNGVILRGGVESFISEAALVARARKRGLIGADGTLDAIVAAADRGGEKESHLLSEAGYLLGVALAGAVHLSDPEVVIVSGEGSVAWSHWEPGFETGFRSSLLPARRGIPVAIEAWQDEGWARGAAALVLATPFDAAGIAGGQGAEVRARLQSSENASS